MENENAKGEVRMQCALGDEEEGIKHNTDDS